ncbi:MAG: hypothetical protein ACREI3_02735 [Nitrospirales bacterium]
MRGFETGDEYFGVKSPLDFGGVCAFQKKLDGFFQVGRSLFNRGPWLAIAVLCHRCTSQQRPWAVNFSVS